MYTLMSDSMHGTSHLFNNNNNVNRNMALDLLYKMIKENMQCGDRLHSSVLVSLKEV